MAIGQPLTVHNASEPAQIALQRGNHHRSFSSRAWPVKTLIPSEHTFSVVVRSARSGSSMVEIWSGIATSIRFSSLPDRKGISEITFPMGVCRPRPDGVEPIVSHHRQTYCVEHSLIPGRFSSAGVCLRLPRKFRSPRLPLFHSTIGLRSKFFNQNMRGQNKLNRVNPY